MLPKILGIAVPPEIIAKAPPVSKLTLLEANRTLRENSILDEKNNERFVKEDGVEMEIPGNKKRRNQRRRKAKKSATRAGEVNNDEDCDKMEVSSATGKQHRKRGKNRACPMDAEDEVKSEKPCETT